MYEHTFPLKVEYKLKYLKEIIWEILRFSTLDVSFAPQNTQNYTRISSLERLKNFISFCESEVINVLINGEKESCNAEALIKELEDVLMFKIAKSNVTLDNGLGIMSGDGVTEKYLLQRAKALKCTFYLDIKDEKNSITKITEDYVYGFENIKYMPSVFNNRNINVAVIAVGEKSKKATQYLARSLKNFSRKKVYKVNCVLPDFLIACKSSYIKECASEFAPDDDNNIAILFNKRVGNNKYDRFKNISKTYSFSSYSDDIKNVSIISVGKRAEINGKLFVSYIKKIDRNFRKIHFPLNNILLMNIDKFNELDKFARENSCSILVSVERYLNYNFNEFDKKLRGEIYHNSNSGTEIEFSIVGIDTEKTVNDIKEMVDKEIYKRETFDVNIISLFTLYLIRDKIMDMLIKNKCRAIFEIDDQYYNPHHRNSYRSFIKKHIYNSFKVHINSSANEIVINELNKLINDTDKHSFLEVAGIGETFGLATSHVSKIEEKVKALSSNVFVFNGYKECIIKLSSEIADSNFLYNSNLSILKDTFNFTIIATGKECESCCKELKEFINATEIEVYKESREMIVNIRLGIHARPAAKLTQLCMNSSCFIEFKTDDMVVDPKSIMDLMMLSGVQGKRINVFVASNDHAECISTLDGISEILKEYEG